KLDPNGLHDNGGPTLTIALLPGSPALGTGYPVGAPQYDQRGPGFARISGGTVDIGAFELQQNSPPVDLDESGDAAEDVAATGNLLANASDPDGDALSVTGFTVGNTSYKAGQSATIAGVGTLAIGADGGYTFSPALNYAGTVPAVSYTVSDGSASDT